MLAPEAFAKWMCSHQANDQKFGRKVFHYHPRSDEHSKMLCRLIFRDLVTTCPQLAEHVQQGIVVGAINAVYTFPNGKRKTLDLAVGEPIDPAMVLEPDEVGISTPLKALRMSCEAKQCMTEHSKTKPRIFDELSSSHEIVHQGDTNIIAAGAVVVNIAEQFVSPTRQTSADGPPLATRHRQPDVTASMVKHLEGLIMRQGPGAVGFDAFATIVVNCDNVGPCVLHEAPPAPQPGCPHHYETFLRRISEAYASRFS